MKTFQNWKTFVRRNGEKKRTERLLLVKSLKKEPCWWPKGVLTLKGAQTFAVAIFSVLFICK